MFNRLSTQTAKGSITWHQGSAFSHVNEVKTTRLQYNIVDVAGGVIVLNSDVISHTSQPMSLGERGAGEK